MYNAARNYVHDKCIRHEYHFEQYKTMNMILYTYEGTSYLHETMKRCGSYYTNNYTSTLNLQLCRSYLQQIAYVYIHFREKYFAAVDRTDNE